MKRVFTISIALLLLVATTGVTLNKHYCMGRLKSVAIFASANPCSENGVPTPMPCCEDTSEQLKVDDLTKASFDFKGTTDLYQIAVITYVLLEQNYLTLEEDKPAYYNYSPPLPDQDIRVLNQVFRI